MKPNRNEVIDSIEKLWLRTHAPKTDSPEEVISVKEVTSIDEDPDMEMDEEAPKEDFASKTRAALNRKYLEVEDTENDDETEITLKTRIMNEIQMFERTAKRSVILKYCYDNLFAIPTTSVEAERNFSIAGRFCNKLRSRLADKTIRDLSMLKSFFIAEDKK